jgi:hypothetical protein
MYKHTEKISRAMLIFSDNLLKKKNYKKCLPQRIFHKVILIFKLSHLIIGKKIYERMQKFSPQISVKISIFYILSSKFYGKLFYHITDVNRAPITKKIRQKNFSGINTYLKTRLFFNHSIISSKKRSCSRKKKSSISSSSYRKFRVLHFCYSEIYKIFLPNFKKQYKIDKKFFSKKKTFRKKKILSYLEFFGKNILKNEKSLHSKKTDKLNNFPELNKFSKNILYIIEKSNHFFGKSFRKELNKKGSEEKFYTSSLSEIQKSNFLWLTEDLLVKNKENLKIKKKNQVIIGKKEKSANMKKKKTNEFGMKLF